MIVGQRWFLGGPEEDVPACPLRGRCFWHAMRVFLYYLFNLLETISMAIPRHRSTWALPQNVVSSNVGLTLLQEKLEQVSREASILSVQCDQVSEWVHGK